MNIIEPSVKILLTKEEAYAILRKIERCGRICYKSEDKITEKSYEPFIKGIVNRGHFSVIEHGSFTAIFVCDRGVTHEIVRHRLASYSQESTRYCKYGTIGAIMPQIDNDFASVVFTNALRQAEDAYLKLLDSGLRPEIARGVLPTSLKTEIAVTANLREWRHIFEMRCSKYAHPQIRLVMIDCLKQAQELFPVIFGDFHFGDDNTAFTIHNERAD